MVKICMKAIALTALLSVSTSLEGGDFYYEEEFDEKWHVIMTAPYKLRMKDPIFSQNGNCKVEITKNGELSVKRNVNGFFRKAWATESYGTGVDNYISYAADFDANAQIVLYGIKNETNDAKKKILYETTYKETLEVWRMGYTHKLRIDNMCRLMVEPYDDDYMGWASVKTYFDPMFSYLQKGDMFNDVQSQPPLTLHLQHNCNLIVFEGHDLADKGRILWSSQTPSFDNETECHVFGDWDDERYTLGLYEGRFQPFFFTGRNSNPYLPGGKNLWNITSNEFSHLFLTREGPILERAGFHFYEGTGL